MPVIIEASAMYITALYIYGSIGALIFIALAAVFLWQFCAGLRRSRVGREDIESGPITGGSHAFAVVEKKSAVNDK